MIRNLIKWVVFKLIYPLCYYAGAVRKIDSQKVIFVENHGLILSNDFLEIEKKLVDDGFQIQSHFLGVSSATWSRIILNTCRLLYDMSNAKLVFCNESNSAFGSFRLRANTNLVQLWHACGAFKKWGQSVVDKKFGDDQKNFNRYNGHKNYTLVPVSGNAVCSIYEEAFGLPQQSGIVKPFGVSRTDVFFREAEKKMAYEKLHSVRQALCKEEKRKVVLYMPTFRGSIKNAKTPNQFDVKKFCQTYKKQYILLIKQHPFVKEPYSIPEQCKDSCIEISNQMTTQELLMVADCMVTDYSSVVFEYSLMNKPMIFFAFDLEEYYDERGFYYPYEEFVPGQIAKSMEELLECFENLSDDFQGQVKEFREKYMNGCDGHATQRILAYCKSNIE